MAAIAKLALEDGTVYTGTPLGAIGEITGEVVFNTSMTGYQEILTDPSYRGQIVTMTYTEIGNYGVTPDDCESSRPHLAGFIVRQASPVASNFRASGELDDYLKTHGIVGIQGIDTRALVRRIRSLGAMKGIVSSVDVDDASLIAKAKAAPGLVGRDLVSEVLPDQPKDWQERLSKYWYLHDELVPASGTQEAPGGATGENAPHIVALDFGMKWNIPRHLVAQGFRVTVLPGTSSAEQVLALSPDGVFLSNGPGDPEPLEFAIATIRQLLGKVPVFGICLGHQLLALACGAKTYKMKFGHRGANQPVLHLPSGRIEISTQNHGFAVEEETLPDCLEITHRNLNDQTIAGLRHKTLPAFCVQYHPEASAGPHDSRYLFEEFQKLVHAHGVS